jgi:hypothetical protein
MYTYEDLGINKTSVYQDKSSGLLISAEDMFKVFSLLGILDFNKDKLIKTIKECYTETPKVNDGVFERIDKLEKLCNEMIKAVEELKHNAT